MTPHYSDEWLTIYGGDCREVLASLPSDSVDCVVTSPPYWGLRDYGNDGQLGLERTPEEYVANMVAVFSEVRRVLKPSGTCWLNLGDSYAGSWGAQSRDKVCEGCQSRIDARGCECGPDEGMSAQQIAAAPKRTRTGSWVNGRSDLKPKDLVGIPWRVAFALQADGWYLRSDIIWSKPNPMPESVTDRPTKAHEYLFLLTKSARYYFDSDAVRESVADATVDRLAQNVAEQNGSTRQPGKTNGPMRAVGTIAGRNIRSVWTIATRPYPGAHFAVFPPELPERCIKAGSSERGVCPECGAPWERVAVKSRATFTRTDDPTLLTGRRGMNRPRLGEADRYVLGVPQPDLAATLRSASSGRTDEMRSIFGSKWDHWTRTDASGARVPTVQDANLIFDLLGVVIPFDGQPGAWQPTCHAVPHSTTPEVLVAEPAVVLDPFAGSGTVGMVANRLSRRAILIDLNPEYLKQQMTRNAQTPLGLTEGEPAA